MGKPEIIGEDLTISAEDLVPNDWNPNEMSTKTFERIRKEIREHGFSGDKRLLVRDHPTQKGKHEIIDGEHRWRAGKLEGMTEFPCTKVNVPSGTEASFRTFVLNNLHGEINEIKLAVLISNWREKNVPANAIYDRTGIRIYKQHALLKKLQPKSMSEAVLKPTRAGVHTSLAFVLTHAEAEIVHRAIKLTRLHKDADAVIEIAHYYLEHHELPDSGKEIIDKLLTQAESGSDAQGLVDLCAYYLANVSKNEIRRDR